VFIDRAVGINKMGGRRNHCLNAETGWELAYHAGQMERPRLNYYADVGHPTNLTSMTLSTKADAELEGINHRCRVDQKQRLIRQIVKYYRLHSSRNRRSVWALSFPQRPRPEPMSGVSGRCRLAAS
jgi:hypothetical protein